MKKLGILLALFWLTVVGVLAGWSWQMGRSPMIIQTSYQQPPTNTRTLAPSPLARQPPPIIPKVDPQRLMVDLKALSFERFDQAGRDRARAYITQALMAAGWSPRSQPFEQGVNIIAERPGLNPDAGKILLAAHYDSVARSPGADDNATGVVAVLEVARLLSQQLTPRTLQVALFDLEEAGLLGSFAFADDASERDDLKGVVVLEMLGYSCDIPGCQRYPAVLPITPPTDRGNFIAVIGDQGHMPLIDSFVTGSSSDLPQVLTLPVPLLGPFTPDLLRSDHAPFWQKGIGAVMVTDTANFRTPHYHQPTDTPDTVNPDFFAGATQLVVNAVTHLLYGQENLATSTAVVSPADESLPATSL